MAERKFRPGTRQKRFTEGRMSEQRLAWLYTYIGHFVIMKYDQPEKAEDGEEVVSEPGPTIRLMLPQQRGRSLMFNFTALTHEELVKVRKLFDMLFDLAEPIVKERDKAAQDAYERGDDSFTRVYRAVPELVVRKGALADDGEGVRRGPQDVPSGDRSGGDSEVRVLDDSDELADGESTDRLAEDDGQEAN